MCPSASCFFLSPVAGPLPVATANYWGSAVLHIYLPSPPHSHSHFDTPLFLQQSGISLLYFLLYDTWIWVQAHSAVRLLQIIFVPSRRHHLLGPSKSHTPNCNRQALRIPSSTSARPTPHHLFLCGYLHQAVFSLSCFPLFARGAHPFPWTILLGNYPDSLFHPCSPLFLAPAETRVATCLSQHHQSLHVLFTQHLLSHNTLTHSNRHMLGCRAFLNSRCHQLLRQY